MKLSAVVLISCMIIGIQPGRASAADDFPNRTITITNPFPAGGGVDIVARAVGQALSEKWKVPVVIVSKPGAGIRIAAAYVARQPADGYNLFVTTNDYSISPSIYKNLAYDPIKDLTPVMLLTSVTQALTINPNLPVNSVAELVDYAKKNPNKILYGSAGVGTHTHLAVELFKKSAGIEMVHVPYHGSVPAITDVIAGRVQMYLGALVTNLQQIRAGSLKALAVMQAKRSPLIPNVPSIVEAGYPDLAFGGYYGILAPGGTPRPVIDKLAAGIKEALDTAEVKKLIYDLACEGVGAGPDEFASFLKTDIERWRTAVEISGIRPM